MRGWYDARADTVNYVYGWVLAVVGVIAIATGVTFGLQQIHNNKLVQATCHRSIKYGPYLARLYDTTFPGPHGRPFRVMPHEAALAYMASIPKHC